MTQEIGFFGGSFDPVHFGHINLALQMMETHHLREILFCPAFCSPFKKDQPPKASPEQRLEMVQLALRDIPGLRVLALEVERGGVSYTVETLRILAKQGYRLRLILSEEAAAHFHRWKEPEEILRLAPPLVGVRKDSALKNLPQELNKGFTITRVMEISSTEIRDRLKKKMYCGHLMPGKSLDYIHSNRLYS